MGRSRKRTRGIQDEFIRAGLIFQNLPRHYRNGEPLPCNIPNGRGFLTHVFLSTANLSVRMGYLNSIILNFELAKIRGGVNAGLGGSSVTGAPPLSILGLNSKSRSGYRRY